MRPYYSFSFLIMLLSSVQPKSLIFLMLLFPTVFTNLNSVYSPNKGKLRQQQHEGSGKSLESKSEIKVRLDSTPRSCVTFGKSLMSLVSTWLKFKLIIYLKQVVQGWNILQKLSLLWLLLGAKQGSYIGGERFLGYITKYVYVFGSYFFGKSVL